MTEAPEQRLMAADPEDLAGALAFALRYSGRKRTHNADEIMAEIVAKRSAQQHRGALRLPARDCSTNNSDPGLDARRDLVRQPCVAINCTSQHPVGLARALRYGLLGDLKKLIFGS